MRINMAASLLCAEEMMEESPDVEAELKEKKSYLNRIPPEVISCPQNLIAFVDKNLLQNSRVFPGMLQLEKISTKNIHNYFKTLQDDITPAMKQTVALWMFEVCEEEKMNNAVFIRAVQYMDKFLSLQRISRTQLQLLGAVCILVSSKIAGTTISSHRLVDYTDKSISREMLLDWEGLVLQLLEWDMYGIVSADFVQHILGFLPKEMWDKSDVLERIKTFIAYCAVDYQLGIHLPSIIASASIVAAMSPYLSSESRNQVLSLIHKITRIDLKEILSCMEQITAKVQVTVTSQQLSSDDQGCIDATEKDCAANAKGCRIKAR